MSWKNRLLLNNIVLVLILAEFSYEECQLTETKFTCDGDDARKIIYEYNSKNVENIKITDIEITNSSNTALNMFLGSLEVENKMRIKKLKFRNCDIEDISGDIFTSFNALEVLDLNNNEIENLHFIESLPEIIREIHLEHNKIKDVPESFSSLKNLKVIDMSYCKIESIDFTVFKNNLNLVLVNVSHNNIKSSISEEFLKNIKCVDMSHNKLEIYNNIPSYCLDLGYTDMAGYRWYNISEKNRTVYIEKFFFSGNSHLHLSATNINNESLPIDIKFLNISSFTGSVSDLNLDNVKVRKELILKDSNIPILEKSVFDFKVLFFDDETNATFDLSNCSITEISPLYFEKYSLGRLNLCHNKFETLKNTVFKDAYLIQLDLCDSRIETIENQAFQGVHSILLNLSRNNIDNLGFLVEIRDIRILDLSHNRIVAINPENFYVLTRLQKLYLNDNSIATIGTGTFTLENIQLINLCNNKLTEIRTRTFYGNPHLEDIILRGNPLVAIETNAFNSLQSLQIVDLGQMNIVHVQPQAFINLQNLSVVYLNDNDLSELKPNIFVNVPSLKKIRLEGNCLKNIDSLNELQFDTLGVKICDSFNFNNFYNPNLKYLHVIDSNLNSFQGFPSYNLLEVYFENSSLTTLQPNTLSGLFNVVNIDGRELFRTVDVIPKYAFRDMRSLKNLDLSGLTITVVEPRAFEGLMNLKKLSIAKNRIVELRDLSFYGLNNLMILDLCGNQISVIDPYTFNGVNNIRILHLYDNNLSVIPLGTFNNINSLQVMDLNNNRIAQLGIGTFSNLPNLRILDLSHNQLNSICSGLFFPLTNLEKLNLEGNRLNYISATDLISYSPRLRSVQLHNNKWNCNTLKHILLDLRSGNISTQNAESDNFVTDNIIGISCESNCI